MRIDRDRLLSDLETLATINDDTPPGISRLVFAKADQQARGWLKSQCRAAGLAVREDPVGNMFARWVGARPELAAIGTGSHIDAIPHSGKFDGTVGCAGWPGGDSYIAAEWLRASAIDRAVALYRGGAHALWSRMPGQPDAERRSRFVRGYAIEGFSGQHAGPTARGRRLRWCSRPSAPAGWLLCRIRRIAYRTGTAARAGGFGCGHRDQHRRAGSLAHHESKAKEAMPAAC